MLIKKVQIEGGFLQGLEVNLEPGLNTIIGSRGTGKSSLVELIRYCLGIKRYTRLTTDESNKHAMQVLEDGLVTVTIEESNEYYEMVGTANRVSERPVGITKWPLMFSQTDIEGLGIDQDSKRIIIDGFNFNKETALENKNRIKTNISKLCDSITSIQQEIEEIDENEKKIINVKKDIDNLKSKQTNYDFLNKNFTIKNETLNILTKEISSYHVEEERFKFSLEKIAMLLHSQRVSCEILDELDSKKKPDMVSDVLTDFIKNMKEKQYETKVSLEQFTEMLASVSLNISGAINKLTEESFKVRKEIEEFEAGSSDINRNIMSLSTTLSILQSKTEDSELKRVELDSAKIELIACINKLSEIDTTIYNNRVDIINKINESLYPTIKITCLHADNTLLYADSFENCFRGSSVKYKDIITDLASTISKKELLRIIFEQDFEAISLFLGTTKQRSLSLLSVLSIENIAKVLLTDVEDTIDFCLLDSGVFKPFSHLSVGQRCTVILPIIFQNEGLTVIIDQPEDHIDNAFIAGTLIPSIKKCSESGQLIIITHNANIPVLGEANNIIHLDSDGRRGFVRDQGGLDSKAISETISNLMEGGRDAFNTRAEFYSK
ncbi:hypothetical protein [Yersinia enterocolitica]|uniref:hypothetical protein n=1 Tax=Yersinia enterocolitica TaxID=630 RepID=UPI003D7BF686